MPYEPIDDRVRFAFGVEIGRAERLAIARAELEDIANFDRSLAAVIGAPHSGQRKPSSADAISAMWSAE